MAPLKDVEISMTDVVRTTRQTAWLLIIGGVIGLVASFELIIQKINLLSNPDATLNCDINPVLSCGSVINTGQASVFGFPNAILGVAGFSVLIMFGALLFSNIELPRWMWIGLQFGSLIGFIFIIWLVVQSLYVIGALCPWCMVVWTVMVPIFWQVTADNLINFRIRLSQRIAEVIVALKGILIAATYLIVIGLIFVRWADFWLK